jgi:hypothetical protein
VLLIWEIALSRSISVSRNPSIVPARSMRVETVPARLMRFETESQKTGTSMKHCTESNIFTNCPSLFDAHTMGTMRNSCQHIRREKEVMALVIKL